VLWETFGTDVTPNVGDVVKNVKYEKGVIVFETPSAYKEGNAVIAAKDANGTILWSWHIWLTKEPQEIKFNNSSVIMMDRNLGALSAVPGDYLSAGFYYQWGRKDPFPGTSDLSEYKRIATYPTDVFINVDDPKTAGTVEYAIANPTALIKENMSNFDWLVVPDYTLWGVVKTKYDPCPTGWKVPEPDLYSELCITGNYTRDDNNGVLFGTNLSTPIAYFPALGTMSGGSYFSQEFAESCHYWTSDSRSRFCVYSDYSPDIYLSFNSHGFPIRCFRDGR
jgi:hypothetical protein